MPNKLLVCLAPLVRASRHANEVLDENHDGVEHQTHDDDDDDDDQLLHRAVGHLLQVFYVALAHPHERRAKAPRVAEAPPTAGLEEAVSLQLALSDLSELIDCPIVIDFRRDLEMLQISNIIGDIVTSFNRCSTLTNTDIST